MDWRQTDIILTDPTPWPETLSGAHAEKHTRQPTIFFNLIGCNIINWYSIIIVQYQEGKISEVDWEWNQCYWFSFSFVLQCQVDNYKEPVMVDRIEEVVQGLEGDSQKTVECLSQEDILRIKNTPLWKLREKLLGESTDGK